MNKASYDINTETFITKLTALWAISESGLGGIIHALKIPFGGILLAGFAIVVISMIASVSTSKWKDILKATLIVLMIKAIASPHSPITAYMAVSFQGLLGAILYSLLPLGYASTISYAVIALLESAVQKLLFLVLIFGNTLWTALRDFSGNVAQSLDIAGLQELPELMLGIYLSLYLLGGILAGIFAVRAPRLLQSEWDHISKLDLHVADFFDTKKKKKSSRNKLWLLVFLALFVASIFLVSSTKEQALWALLRSFGALFLFYAIANPLLVWLLKRWSSSNPQDKSRQLEEVLMWIPNFKTTARLAQAYAENQSGALRKLQKFTIAWIALSLNQKYE